MTRILFYVYYLGGTCMELHNLKKLVIQASNWWVQTSKLLQLVQRFMSRIIATVYSMFIVNAQSNHITITVRVDFEAEWRTIQQTGWLRHWRLTEQSTNKICSLKLVNFSTPTFSTRFLSSSWYLYFSISKLTWISGGDLICRVTCYY